MRCRSLGPLALLLVGCAVPPSPLTALAPVAPTAPAVTTAPPAAAWQPGSLDPARRAKLAALVPELDRLFAADLASHHYPGLGVGIVIDGELVYAKGFGHRDAERKALFDADTRFPIASVTKGFTAMAILQLRDEGKLSLDEPAARYYAPLASLAYPTRDSPPITIRHLLTHASGLPEDNPWADVTDELGEAELARMVASGMSFSRAPGVHLEYSNIGYAVLGRVIQGAPGVPARTYLRREILTPLGMTGSSLDVGDLPPGSVAVGYRGREGAGDSEAPPVIAPIHKLGTFDTAGGVFTTLRDLGRYVAFQLDAWPPRDAAEAGPLRRSSVREMQQGARAWDISEFMGSLLSRHRPTTARLTDDGLELNAGAYGFGLQTGVTCEDDVKLGHTGGLPGYITFMQMLPERGFGIFEFVNDERLASIVIEDATELLRKAGLLPLRSAAPAPALVDARAVVHGLLARWDAAAAQALFEPTVFRYQSVETLKQRLTQLAKDHGACRADGALRAVNRLRGAWREPCERGAITFAAALSPEAKPRLQALEWREETPPGPALTRAATALARLVERWDPKLASGTLAPSVDLVKLRRAFARLALDHGRCQVDRSVEGDGKSSATFLLSCAQAPLELQVALDEKTGRVTRATGHPPASDERPNCAE